MRPQVKILLLVCLALASALIAKIWLGPRFEMATIIDTLRRLGTSGAAIPLYFLIFGAATSVFAPAAALMVVGGVMWGFWPGWLIVWGATNVWVNVHFALARWIAGDAFKGWLSRRGANWLLRELEHGGVLTTVVIRQLPLPFPLVNLAGGVSPMPYRKWLLGNAIGLVPNSMVYTQLAAALADGVDGAREAAAYRVVSAAAVVIGLGLLSRWLQRRLTLGQ